MVKKMLTKVTCPHCNKSITLDEVFAHSLKDKMDKEYENKYNL